MLDFARTWLPFIYLYGIGGFAFVVGMVLILRTGALNLERRRHSRWLKVLLFGFVFYAVLHAFFILFALRNS
ncbi:MAG: hypothetical protein VX822_03630 [Candidatus Neomarinimicrobiota bacterium]|nr:hypothetical protein [Candidatus Neomarinimicrobiota bacterium]